MLLPIKLVMVMKSSWGSFGDIGNLLGFLYVDKALSMIVSAFAAALAVRTTTARLQKW
jgi:hypothetical protein